MSGQSILVHHHYTMIHPVPIVDPPYQKTAEYEKFDHLYWKAWVGSNWTLGIYFAIGYIALIFGLKHWMRNREPFDLRTPLVVWNLGMGLFSAMAVYRCYSNLWHILATEGWHHSVCYREGMTLTQQFWNFMILWSKVAELVDTLFLVLRKSPLIFLHWYHHAVVVGLVFYAYDTYDPVSRWYFAINISIHALMYTYYGLKAARVYVPKYCSMALTTMQILQFTAGFVFSAYSLYGISIGDCERNPYDILMLEIPIGISFFTLFANYFKKAYSKGGKHAIKKDKEL